MTPTQPPHAPRALSVLIVGEGRERYAIPMAQVRETALVDLDDLVLTSAGEKALVHGRLLPLMPLSRVLKCPRMPREEAFAIVLVLKTGALARAIEVSRLESTQAIAWSPLMHEAVTGTLGAVELPDGQLALVIDLEALLGLAEAEAEDEALALAIAAAEANLEAALGYAPAP